MDTGFHHFCRVLRYPESGYFLRSQLSLSVVLLRHFEDRTVTCLLIIVSVTLALCAFTVASALWAFSGQNEGRIAFLTIVSLNFLWWTFFVILGISNSENAQSTVNLVFSLVRPVIWISALWYFFTKKDILAYYHQSKEIDLQAD